MKLIFNATIVIMALAAVGFVRSVHALNTSVLNVLKKSQSPPSVDKLIDESNQSLHTRLPSHRLMAAVNDQPTLKERIFSGGKSLVVKYGSGVVASLVAGWDEFYADVKGLFQSYKQRLPYAIEKSRATRWASNTYIERKQLEELLNETFNAEATGIYTVVYGVKGMGKWCDQTSSYGYAIR